MIWFIERLKVNGHNWYFKYKSNISKLDKMLAIFWFSDVYISHKAQHKTKLQIHLQKNDILHDYLLEYEFSLIQKSLAFGSHCIYTIQNAGHTYISLPFEKSFINSVSSAYSHCLYLCYLIHQHMLVAWG